MVKITFKNIFKQLKADLIGKDSYRGVSLSYSWLANQFGHFSLGFFIAFIINALDFKVFEIHFCFTLNNSIAISAIFWTIFESYNFLGPLLLKKNSEKIKLNINKQYTFQPEWLNVGFDTFTDLLFFYLGALFLSLFDLKTGYLDGLFLILSFLILIPSAYWYRTKMILQACKFPEQIRLSQWKFDLNQINKDIVLNFINSESQIKHLLVFGNTGSGKTTLSIGMATELAIKRFSCTYTTAMKISALFYKENQFELTDYFWDWRNSNCLIIDDFNPTNPIIEQIITPELFLNYIQNDGNDSVNKSILINKKVIWLIGKNDCQDNWIALLLKLGVKKSEMNLIDLRN